MYDKEKDSKYSQIWPHVLKDLKAGMRVIDLNVIKHIPNAFDGKEINYGKALELAIDQKLKSKEERSSLVIL